MTSAAASATSAATSVRRARFLPAPAVVRCPPSFSATAVASGARCRSGARPEDRAGREADAERDCEHAEVERNVGRPRQALAIRGDQPAKADHRDAEPEDRARERQQTSLHHELPQEPPPPGAERKPHRELLVARFSAREQQIREVGARDQQDEDDRALQHEHRRLRTPHDLRLQRVEADAMSLRVRRVRTVGRAGRP
jgi:hypothetical protein